MTAVRKQLVSADRPVDFSTLIGIDEAAPLLGVSEGHLRRVCGDELQGRGLAVLANPPGGGRSRWYVHRSYDLRLSGGVLTARHTPQDLSDRYTAKQISVAMMRRDCVMQFRAARATTPGLQRDWIDGFVADLRRAHPQLKISARTLMRWWSDFKGEGDLEKLIDTRGRDQKSQGDPAAWAFFKDIFLDERQPTIRSCWKRAEEHAVAGGLRWCSYVSCRRQLDDRIAPEVQLRHRDPRAWRSTAAPYIEQDPERHAAGECWVGDHRPLDLFCRIGDRVFRPFITAWQDWRTRKVVGALLTENPNSSSILAAFRMGLIDPTNMGGPSMVWIDNGRDYDCWAFHGQTKQQRRSQGRLELEEAQHKGLFALLGIEAHFSLAYNPTGKGRMERWFATVGDHFDKTFPTYTGNKPDAKPEELREILDKVETVPTFDQVCDRFRLFVDGYNRNAAHSMDDLVDVGGERLSPDEAMGCWRQTRRVFADPRALDLLLMKWHKPVRVGRNGIRITVAGETLRYGYLDPALSRYKLTKHELNVAIDPSDLRHVNVYDAGWVYVTTAKLNDTGGAFGDPLREDHARELNRRKAAYNRGLKQTRENYETQYLSTEEQLALAASRATAPTTPSIDRPMTIVQTPLDGQSKQIARGVVRKAAGAENSGAGRGLDEDLAGGLPSLDGFGFAEAFQIGDYTGEDDEPARPSDLLGVADDAAAGDADFDGLSPWSGFAAEGAP